MPGSPLHWLGAAALLLAAAWLLAPKLHRFAYWGVRRDAAAVTGLARAPWRAVPVTTEDGERLLGFVQPPRDAAARWVLLLPGNASDVVAAFTPVLDDVVAVREVGAAFWPWRGFDASTGTPGPAGLLADARAAWRHLAVDLGVPAARIELWGYSLGTGLAVQLAAELCSRGEAPAQVVLLSAYDRIAVMGAGAFARFAASDVYDAMPAAARVTCPVTIVHGTVDDALPIAGARALQRAIGAHARLVELPGKGHVDYLRDLPELLRTSLAATPGRAAAPATAR